MIVVEVVSVQAAASRVEEDTQYLEVAYCHNCRVEVLCYFVAGNAAVEEVLVVVVLLLHSCLE